MHNSNRVTEDTYGQGHGVSVLFVGPHTQENRCSFVRVEDVKDPSLVLILPSVRTG